METDKPMAKHERHLKLEQIYRLLTQYDLDGTLIRRIDSFALNNLHDKN